MADPSSRLICVYLLSLVSDSVLASHSVHTCGARQVDGVRHVVVRRDEQLGG